MNNKNFEYLRDQVKFTGFGEGLATELKDALSKGEQQFSLEYHAQYQQDYIQASLNFNKSKETDLYFFNSYKMELQKQGGVEQLTQQFYIHKDNNITMKEAYNLLSGRSVHKELINQQGEKYQAWLQLDFKQSDSQGNFKMNQYHENYGYDLVKELEKHPIEQLTNPQYQKELLESLKKGNLQSVNLKQGDQVLKIYVEANPQYKTINLYDANIKKINHSISQHQRKGQTQDEKKSTKVKQGTAVDDVSSDKPSKKRIKPSLG